jgi:hypothetical protein
VKDIDRQMKLEADAVHDGLLGYAQSYEYQLATDSKPMRDLLGHCLKPLADAIRAEQLELKTSQRQKLPKYGIPLLSINPETMALVTLGMLFNSITRSEFNERRRASLRFHTKSASAAALKESLTVSFTGTTGDIVPARYRFRPPSRDSVQNSEAICAHVFLFYSS